MTSKKHPSERKRPGRKPNAELDELAKVLNISSASARSYGITKLRELAVDRLRVVQVEVVPDGVDRMVELAFKLRA